MFAIMTVTGVDHTGIIAAVSTACAEMNVNIHNVSQTLMGEYFTMILHVAFDEAEVDIATIQERMDAVGEQEQLVIRIQSQAIFDAMNVI
ncbi:ACT domain-containing protein [Corynebacterium sp. 153RC1]|uniref:ACT domain-containing protein n=1 Tax=Corynebacterium TaxID=1716 RepID=UPI00211BD0A3|nr:MULTISPECIES: ACT domain-containing protein [unclassified Corynebacterium]MCQ9369745.1 ACT domain-containing protein [Corynebacterium sp. 35RC1]MCQ9342839.1 ACT domain-containing protein [Corynebacterium sp. 76QC2CO]MCQ9352404.1 ACT domain-containing protein [Corynebacterium sp. 209RC1]MCQ9354424.1 ACT domain-containing protein [Corynebacterium sp. 1222RC1]MCQ9356687.1 ACT domain-containing protein [Corynebacterium sp. 122RC1]